VRTCFEKALKKSAVVKAIMSCEPFRDHEGAHRVARTTLPASDSLSGPGKNICDRLLTVEKTVIRFRPSRRCLQNRVSRIITTTRSIKRTSARKIITVDAGSVSFAKTQRHQISRTRNALRGGFFVAGTSSSRHAESVPARLARRRLIAGPTPAVSLRTGQF
jgi:hypothetical protein